MITGNITIRGTSMGDKIQEISAIIGAVYIIARVVVVLTPTEADNKVLKQIMKWVSRIAFVTGMDMKQGVNKYGPK
jgi:hypothetical protein